MHQKLPNNDKNDSIENVNEKNDEIIVLNEWDEFDAMNVADLVKCYETGYEEAQALENHGDIPERRRNYEVL